MKLRVDRDLLLRSVRPADRDALFLVVDGHREHLRRWLPWVDATRSPADTAAFIASSRDNERGGTGLAALVEWRGEICGSLGFDAIDRAHRAGDMGYWLRTDCVGRGLVTRCGAALLAHAYGTLGLHRVAIRAAVDNRRSRAVAERLGFQFEGILRGAERRGADFVDLALYAKLRGDP